MKGSSGPDPVESMVEPAAQLTFLGFDSLRAPSGQLMGGHRDSLWGSSQHKSTPCRMRARA
jgi:hypothetical protein